MALSERLGAILGLALAPWAALGSALRHARLFHPQGVLLRARFVPLERSDAWGPLAHRLAGPALVRLSSALWKGERERPDALGLALRLGTDDPNRPGEALQDLLFATVRRPFTLPFAPLTTKVHDFLANDYYAVSPFTAPEAARLRLRLVGPGPSPGPSRAERLAGALARGGAGLQLEARAGGAWTPLGRLVLLEEVGRGQDRLRFSPFRDARGLVPVGFVHALRRAVYPASQAARP